MSNVSAKKVFIQIESAAEQQEHLKNQRKTLKVLQQGVATDKENLAGRPQIDRLMRLKASSEASLNNSDLAKRKKVAETRSAETQTSPEKAASTSVTVEDLTGHAKPSNVYWERLAEKRREALEETLQENRHLHERIEGLEEELNTSKQMLEEARNLVEVLTEMLQESEAKDPDAEGDEIEDSGVAVLRTGLTSDEEDSKSSDDLTGDATTQTS